MTTDLALLHFTRSAHAGGGSAIGLGRPAMVSASAFQTALAAQGGIIFPMDQPAPIKPGLTAFAQAATAAPETSVLGQTPGDPALAPIPAGVMAVDRSAAAAPAAARVALPVAEAPSPTALAILPAAPALLAAPDTATLSKPRSEPPTTSAMPAPNGKLPRAGNILPAQSTLPATGHKRAHPTRTTPGAATPPVTAKTGATLSDGLTDEKPASPIDAAGPIAPHMLAPAVAILLPLPLPATMPAITPQAPATTGADPFAAPPPSAIALRAPQLGLSADSGAAQPAASAADPAPVFAVSPLPATLPATGVAPPSPLAQAVADPAANAAPMTRQPLLLAINAPTLAIAPPSGQSTVSRLARQSSPPRDARPAPPASASSATDTLPATGSIPSLATSTAPAPASAPSSLAKPPQDFAVLVDRLLEARAAAQGSTAPLPVSTSITHKDFGKVSLTFSPDLAGLSVSMTSADPGFARAAQSAIASSAPDSSGQASSAAQFVTGITGHQGLAGDASQGFTQPGTVAQAHTAPSGQSASGFSSASGGSPQPQPQPRPGSIAAANRSPAAPRDSDATSTGIFA